MYIEKAKFTKDVKERVLQHIAINKRISREIPLDSVDSQVMQCYINACNIVKMYSFPNSFCINEGMKYACWVFIGISDNGHIFAWFVTNPVIQVSCPKLEKVSFANIDRYYNPATLRPQLIDFTVTDIDYIDIQTALTITDESNSILSTRYFCGVRMFDIVYIDRQHETHHNFFNIEDKPDMFNYIMPYIPNGKYRKEPPLKPMRDNNEKK